MSKEYPTPGELFSLEGDVAVHPADAKKIKRLLAER